MNAIGIKKKFSKLQLISEPAVGAQLQLKDICANDFQLSFAAQSFLFKHLLFSQWKTNHELWTRVYFTVWTWVCVTFINKKKLKKERWKPWHSKIQSWTGLHTDNGSVQCSLKPGMENTGSCLLGRTWWPAADWVQRAVRGKWLWQMEEIAFWS